MNNKAVNSYLKEVEAGLQDLEENEKWFLRDLRDSTYTYAEDHPGCTMAEFYEHFGTPDELVCEYCGMMPEGIRRAASKRTKDAKQIKAILIAGVLAVVLIVTGSCAYATTKYKSTVGAYIEEKIEYLYEEDMIQ